MIILRVVGKNRGQRKATAKNNKICSFEFVSALSWLPNGFNEMKFKLPTKAMVASDHFINQRRTKQKKGYPSSEIKNSPCGKTDTGGSDCAFFKFSGHMCV